jgi:hypothetical protein
MGEEVLCASNVGDEAVFMTGTSFDMQLPTTTQLIPSQWNNRL